MIATLVGVVVGMPLKATAEIEASLATKENRKRTHQPARRIGNFE